MELEQQDVGVSTQDPAVIAAADSSTATESSSPESTADGVTVEDAKAVEQEIDPLEGLPTAEELQKQAAEKVPYAAALANLRTAYEGVKPQVEQFTPWKEVVETIGDPAQAKTAYELMKALRTPIEGQPGEYDLDPFLSRVDQEMPGSANLIFNRLLSYEVPDENGKVDTLVRHMYRSHGLDPDRVDDYRNIDTLRASGVVSAEDLARIPEQYREAFRTLSKDGQDDILELLRAGEPSYGLRAEEHLRNAQDALTARQYRQQQEEAQRQAAEQQQVEYRQQVEAAVETDMSSEVKSIHDSILEKSLSQFTFSSDAVQDSIIKGGIMSTLATLQNPSYRFVAENALASVGVNLNGFDDLANRWTQERVKYIAFKAAGQENTWDAREALNKSTFAKQQILAKLNDYALKLAQANGERAAAQASQAGSQLNAATARYVPSGSGQVQGGNPNPYLNNPYEIGTPEYFAFNRKIDKEYKLTGASVFG